VVSNATRTVGHPPAWVESQTIRRHEDLRVHARTPRTAATDNCGVCAPTHDPEVAPSPALAIVAAVPARSVRQAVTDAGHVLLIGDCGNVGPAIAARQRSISQND